MRKLQSAAGFFPLAAVILMTACIDDTYDLKKDIDSQVSFSKNGLTLPTSSTAEIKLSQIIELENDGQLKTDEKGNYYFYKSGETAEATTVSVGYGSICNTVETNFTYHFKDNPTFETSVKYPEWNINTATFTSSVSQEYHPDVLGSHVRALNYVDTPMHIVIEFLDNNISECIPYISEIKYRVPSFYDLEDESDLQETNVKTNQRHYHVIRCKGVDFNAALKNGEKASYDNKTGKIIFKGEINIECKIDYLYMNIYNSIHDPQINIRTIIGSLTTDKVTGRFEKSEHVSIEPITFEDLPDIINAPETVIDLDNPTVRLTVDNEVPARALVNATLKAYRNGTETATLEIGEAYGTDSIKFEGGKKQTVWISRKPTAIPDTVSCNVVIPNMSKLLTSMPDMIKVDGWAHTDSSQIVTMGLNKKYKVSPAYELYAPLVLGANMKLVYKQETDDIHDKLKHLDISRIAMTATAKSNIPIDLTAKLTAKDDKGNNIESISLMQDQTIRGMSDTDFSLVLIGSPNDFQRVDIIELNAYGECNETLAGQPLNENQTIKLENIKITVF